MKIEAWQLWAQRQLLENSIVTARLDVLVLMEHVLDVDRAQILAHPESEVSDDHQNVLNGLIARRAHHEPLAFLLGKTEFYGREFIVSAAVLEPRPESETMIDILKKLIIEKDFFVTGHSKLDLKSRQITSNGAEPASLDSSLRWNDGGYSDELLLRIADVGTGSGALGITAFLELQNRVVELLEISDEAIEIAKRNVIKFTSPITVIKSDLLANSSNDYDVLLCNLPYVPDTYPINEAAKHEPKLALFGGPDGLDLYRRLFKQIESLQKQPLLILTESLPEQQEPLCQIATNYGYRQAIQDDFIQAFITNK